MRETAWIRDLHFGSSIPGLTWHLTTKNTFSSLVMVNINKEDSKLSSSAPALLCSNFYTQLSRSQFRNKRSWADVIISLHHHPQLNLCSAWAWLQSAPTRFVPRFSITGFRRWVGSCPISADRCQCWLGLGVLGQELFYIVTFSWDLKTYHLFQSR